MGYVVEKETRWKVEGKIRSAEERSRKKDKNNDFGEVSAFVSTLENLREEGKVFSAPSFWFVPSDLYLTLAVLKKHQELCIRVVQLCAQNL